MSRADHFACSWVRPGARRPIFTAGARWRRDRGASQPSRGNGSRPQEAAPRHQVTLRDRL